MRKTTLFVLSSLLLNGICIQNLNAQQGTSSPYSRYAFGELTGTSLTAYSSWGSSSIAVSDTTLINLSNPASFSNIMPHRPIFDIGIGANAMTIQSAESSEKTRTAGLRNIALAFPVNKKLGFAFGLLPFSGVGYNMKSVVAEPNIGNVTYSFKGAGGLNQLFLGTGVKLINNNKHVLSLGAKGSYLFGNILRERKANFPAYTGILNSKVKHNTIVSDFVFDAGMHYRITLKDTASSRHWLNIGATFSLPSEVKARQEMLSYTFASSFTEVLVDTVEYIDTIKGHMNFPKKIGAAVSYDIVRSKGKGQYSRYTFNLQFETQDWAQYAEMFGNQRVEDQLSNSNTAGFGFQFIPVLSKDLDLNKVKIWHLINYRVGARYSNTYLQLNNTQLTQYGISFGFGIPLLYSGSPSMINLGVEFGKRGTTENNLLQENFINFSVGFSISPGSYDGWFYKRKYD